MKPIIFVLDVIRIIIVVVLSIQNTTNKFMHQVTNLWSTDVLPYEKVQDNIK